MVSDAYRHGQSGTHTLRLQHQAYLHYNHDGVYVSGGVDLRSLDPQWFRTRIAMVSQEPTLFACSIKENISYGKESTMEEVIYYRATQEKMHGLVQALHGLGHLCTQLYLGGNLQACPSPEIWIIFSVFPVLGAEISPAASAGGGCDHKFQP